MRKTFYKYNPATASYERVYPSRVQRWWAVARQFSWGVTMGVTVFVALYFIFDFPREKELRQENEHLHSRLAQLGRQADEAMAVMEDISARDNNFYRVMMQADPVTDAARYAGLERRNSYARADSMADDALVDAVSAKLDRLDHQVYAQIKSFDFLYNQAHLQRDRIEHVPAIQPVSESKLRQMASGYGYRRDPIYGTSRFHEGMDFSAPVGTPVYATGKGTVVFAGWKSGYGNLIEVDHGYNYVTRYAHLSKIGVKEGQPVERGELIGEIGNTGKSTGPHLHYEVRLRNEPQNPVNYYFYDITPEEYDEMIRQAENAGHVMD